jgi:hypothetical protein
MARNLAERVLKKLDAPVTNENAEVDGITVSCSRHDGEKTILLIFPENTNYDQLFEILGRTERTRANHAGFFYNSQDMTAFAHGKNLMFTCRGDGYSRVKDTIADYLTW